jgi:copper homeostasis protein (lipoprotein)
MRRTHLFLLLAVFVSLTSCIEHQKKRESEEKKADSSTLRQRHYSTVRVYSGTIPCADCAGIIQKLVLKGDSIGIYRLTETYKDSGEDGDATIISSGEWKLIKENNSQQLYLSQGHLQDSSRIMRYEYQPSVLHQLELDGYEIESKFSYTLRLDKKQ